MPKTPTVHRFEIPTQDGILALACVVMDKSEFDAITEVAHEQGLLTAEQAAEIKAIGHIPMIARGKKTEFIFQRFGVEDQRLTMIVRGKGEEVFRRYVGIPNPENN